MLNCPMCKKPLRGEEKECPNCKTDVSLLVAYVANLRQGLSQAEALTRSGDLGEAVWAYLAVLEVDPDNAAARRQVGKVVTAVQFREARLYASLSREQAADMLGVSLRTIGHWETGKARPSWAAFKLLRIYRHGDLIDPQWSGYSLIRGKLVTPENHSFAPHDLTWLSLLVRRADAFSELRRQRDEAKGAGGVAACGSRRWSLERTSMPSITRPKQVCLPLRCGVCLKVRKNCEPPVSRPAWAMLRLPWKCRR